MAITSYTVDGVEVDPRLESFEIRETAGSTSTLTCAIESSGSPVQRFDVFDAIVVEEDGNKIFGGTTTQVLERGDGAPNLFDPDTDAPEILSTLTAEDYVRYAERVVVTEEVAAGTLLKTFLTTLVGYLASLGVTLDPAQVNGPALPAMSFDLARCSDVLQALFDATGYVWRIDYDKRLRMWLPGDLAAPFNINELDDPARWVGDVEVENILGDTYANRVIVKAPDQVYLNFIESKVGDDTWDTWVLSHPITAHRNFVIVQPAALPAGTGFFEPLGDGHPTGPTWTIASDDQTITRLTGNLETGYTAWITYDWTEQILGTAEDAAEIAAHGLVEHVEIRSDITTQAAADALAAQILAERLTAGSQVVTYRTRYTAPTLHAGQQQTITAPARNLSGTYLITDLTIRAEPGLGLIRTVTAKRSQALEGKWQQTYRDWLGGGGDFAATAQTVSVGGSSGAPVGPALPDKSVQFNAGGVFGGDVAFTFDEDTDSLTCGGGGTSITATTPASCQAFGYDTHIAD